MAVNPEAQERAHEEVKKLMAGRSDDRVTANDLNNIPYIKACLKESLRYSCELPKWGVSVLGNFFSRQTFVAFELCPNFPHSGLFFQAVSVDNRSVSEV